MIKLYLLLIKKNKMDVNKKRLMILNILLNKKQWINNYINWVLLFNLLKITINSINYLSIIIIYMSDFSE